MQMRRVETVEKGAQAAGVTVCEDGGSSSVGGTAHGGEGACFIRAFTCGAGATFPLNTAAVSSSSSITSGRRGFDEDRRLFSSRASCVLLLPGQFVAVTSKSCFQPAHELRCQTFIQHLPNALLDTLALTKRSTMNITMTQKRPRKAFEADLQKEQSPYASVGKPEPPSDPRVRDPGAFVPTWKQDAVDDQGRRRFHGAFTGGYSAG